MRRANNLKRVAHVCVPACVRVSLRCVVALTNKTQQVLMVQLSEIGRLCVCARATAAAADARAPQRSEHDARPRQDNVLNKRRAANEVRKLLYPPDSLAGQSDAANCAICAKARVHTSDSLHKRARACVRAHRLEALALACLLAR